ncbi:MAG TPA: hypothetical protein VJ483_00470 [Holophagaceae bacterium]|nr:hypothetical protein [Holophagaceae bacterium]
MKITLPAPGSRSAALWLALGLMAPLAAQEGGRARPMPRQAPRPSPAAPADSPRSDTPQDRRGGVASASRQSARPRVTGPAVTHQRLAPTTAIVTFSVSPRCTVVPTLDFWLHRDLMTEIQLSARRGFIPVTPFPTDQNEMQHYSMAAPGWRAYGFLVPPGGKVRVDLEHPKPAWFRVFWIDKWGSYRPGMMVKPGEPQALYENGTDEVQAVYAIADDPGHWSNEASPYTLKVQRSWDPKNFDPKGMELQDGIWAFDPTFARIDASRR